VATRDFQSGDSRPKLVSLTSPDPNLCRRRGGLQQLPPVAPSAPSRSPAVPLGGYLLRTALTYHRGVVEPLHLAVFAGGRFIVYVRHWMT
jgi:hypothetical protein